MDKRLIKSILLGTVMFGGYTTLIEEESYAVSLNNNVNISKDEVLKKEVYFKGTSPDKSLQYLGEGKNVGIGYKYVKGTKPVIISVPHSIKQPARPNNNDGYGYKSADTYTGTIAQIIAEKTGAHVIYKTSYTGVDDNYTTLETPYRKKVREIIKNNNIKAVFDIHGFADSNRNHAIDLGTDYGRNLVGKTEILDLTLEALEKNNFILNTNKKSNKVLINGVYTGGGGKTMSSYVSSKLNIPTIQIEIGKSFRDPEKMTNFNRIIKTLMDIIDNVSGTQAQDVPTQNKQDLTATVVNVNNSRLNIRAKNTTNSTVLAKASSGDTVYILGDLDKSWFKVKYNNIVGYASSSYLKLNCKIGRVYGVNSHIYLRESAKESSNKIATVKLNETVEILDSTNLHWHKVRYKNKDGKYIIGYASKKYIKEDISETTKYKVINGKINLRTSASWSGTIYTTASVGTVLDVIEINGDWATICKDGKTLYAPANYLVSLDKPVVEPTPPKQEESKPNFTVSALKMNGVVYNVASNDVLNVRETPYYNGKLITTLKNNTRVKVTGLTSNGWYRVDINGKTGYANKKYIKSL